MLSRVIVAGLVSLSIAASAAAQSTIFIVRHAERADTVSGAKPKMGSDPDLSSAGKKRAASLATMLKDTGIKSIFATDLKRTQQTAAPLAKLLGIKTTIVPSFETDKLVAQLKTATGNVLVVGHSDTVPQIIKGLGVQAHLKIEDADYDNLFLVTLESTPRLLRLHYR